MLRQRAHSCCLIKSSPGKAEELPSSSSQAGFKAFLYAKPAVSDGNLLPYRFRSYEHVMVKQKGLTSTRQSCAKVLQTHHCCHFLTRGAADVWAHKPLKSL